MKKALGNFLCSMWLMVFMFSVLPVLSAKEGIKYAGDHPKDTMTLAGDHLVTPTQKAEFNFNLKEIPDGKQVRLYLDARIEWGGLGGNTTCMEVNVNGRGIDWKLLLNKELMFTQRDGQILSWEGRLMYSADFSDRLKTDEEYPYGLVDPEQDPFYFVWDITSLVRAGTNSIEISNNSAAAFSLRLRGVGVDIGDPIPSRNAPARVEPAPTGPLPVYAPKETAQIPAEIEVSANGNIRFNVAARSFTLRSRTSLPTGEWSDEGNANDIWKRLPRGKSFVAKWEGPDYTVERRIKLHSDHIAVADTVSNISEELVGVIFENRLNLPEKPGKTLLGGNAIHMKTVSNPAHPTAMVQFNDLTIGLVAEDDILRLHSELFEETGIVGLADRSLGIPPGKAHTLEWSIYLVPNGDYWDFVNAIRRNWGCNFTLQGPLVFPPVAHNYYVDAEKVTADVLRDWLSQMNDSVTMMMTHVAVNPGVAMENGTKDRPALLHGTAVLDPSGKAWIDNTRRLVRLMKEVDPAMKVFAYLNKNLCCEIGYEQKYRDSVAMDRYGKPAISVFGYPGLFVPTLANSYGKAMAEVCKYYVENLDANIYFDDIVNYAYVLPSDGDTTWDGCTVIIDPVSHAVTRKQSSPFLVVQPWLGSMMDYLKSKSKTAMGNGYLQTRTMLSWGIPCFVEGGEGLQAVMSSHLGTPLAWGGYLQGKPGYEHAWKSLNVGGIPCTRSGDWNDRMFPITPVELHSGVVIGKERILTNRSGRFGWGDDSRAEVYVFDGQGQRVVKPDVKEVRQGDKVLTELRMPSDHLAILVRKKQPSDHRKIP